MNRAEGNDALSLTFGLIDGMRVHIYKRVVQPQGVPLLPRMGARLGGRVCLLRT